ncbi:MAG: homoserine dehydrogenase [Pirellulales bacterium]|nr:homoserine dehydrogenase [Pirellulales bacterium]
MSTKSISNKTKVALVGFGTIGSGVARLLLAEGPRLARAAGIPIELAHVVDPDLKRPRNVTLPEGLLSNDLDRALGDPDVRVVIELIGGTGVAREVVLRALDAGKNVVTANKALVATHGPELFERARRVGRTIAFEAAVAGGLPVIATIGQSLTANRIESIEAILNGTCNFILTHMEQYGLDYADVLAEAQRLGYAEADPTLDVNGADATQKLAILAQMAFGATVDWRDIPRAGIDSIGLSDLLCAEMTGHRIRLIAAARRSPEGIELSVGPTLVPEDAPLADVQGAFNAVSIVGDMAGPIFLQGYGAGQNPTASAVVADVIDTIAGRTAITQAALELWSTPSREPATVRDPATIAGRFYLRVNVQKELDAAAQLSRVLAEHQTPVDSLTQYDDEDSQNLAGIVFLTGQTTEGRIAAAVQQMETLPFVHPEIVRCRVADA